MGGGSRFKMVEKGGNYMIRTWATHLELIFRKRRRKPRCLAKSGNTFSVGQLANFLSQAESWSAIRLSLRPSGTWPHVRTFLENLLNLLEQLLETICGQENWMQEREQGLNGRRQSYQSCVEE